MTPKNPTLSFGIEEEYYLVDRRTRSLAKDPPRRLLMALKKELGPHFSEEYMRSQIEISTPVCHSADAARIALIERRQAIAHHAHRFGLAPIAAATHPATLWRQQRHRDKKRYNDIAHDFQAVGRRMLICGLHVHLGVEDREQRVQLMNGLRAYLPLFLALSASSPFWGGEVTGLKSYRTAINDSTPRKGIPEYFADWQAFEQSVDVLTSAGIIEDATKIWWDIRPSVRYKTLEIRIMDVCPLVEDAVCLASLLRCLARALIRRPPNPAILQGSLVLINENRWRAQRYGLDNGLIDPETGLITQVAEWVDTVLDLVREDAEFFDCVDEVDHARTIVARGTSADRQLARYRQVIAAGIPHRTALASVVDQLIDDTVADLRTTARPTVSSTLSLADGMR